jgi:predicted ATPase/class 3 adenylate cyclase
MTRPVEGSPTGTVTFLFSDVEGSTKLVERFGEAWPELLERHRTHLRAAFAEHHGFEQSTEGDSFFVVFESAPDAVAAAAGAQRDLAAETWPPGGAIRVRIGLHTGEGRLSGGDYVGIDVHRAARIAAAGHGGQVLLSETTASLAGSSLPAGVRLVDLGMHRLKDMPRPERLQQVAIDGLPSEFPPLRTLGARASNLPVALSSLVGRDADVAAVRARLHHARLLTVTGPGGTGKTRLVQEVAREVVGEFDGGATFVPLEALRDASLLPTEILRAMHLDSASPAPPVERLVETIGDRPTLLVLDNLEQLPDAAAVIGELLRSVPSVTVLASSQAALRVAGEQEYGLQPLPEGAAVRLFADRAKAVVPDFTIDDANRPTIIAICERLDGLPLAIELAAAQVRLLSPAAILQRISDRIDSLATRQQDLPERQRTLRGTVTWSYELLSPAEQVLFRRFSAFVGGATIADVEAFEGCRGRQAEALDTLEGLVDRSLVVVRRTAGEEHRFIQLETIRAVARQLLRDAGEEASALDDHATIFERLAVEAGAQLYGSSRRVWLDRLAAEHANVRAALDHDVAAGNLSGALEIAAGIWRFWQTRGHLIEARARLNVLLGLATGRTDLAPALMSRAEEAAGSVAYWMRLTAEAEIEPHYRRSLELAVAAGDKDRQAWAMYNLAFAYDFVAMAGGSNFDPDRGMQLRLQALEIFRAVDDRRGIGESLWALGGSAAAIRDDADRARLQLREAAGVLEGIGDSYGSGWVHTSLGMLELTAGNLAEARVELDKGAAIFLADDDLAGQLITIRNYGALASLSGDDARAVRLDAAVTRLAQRIGVDPPEIEPTLRPIRAARARLSAEAIAREERAAETIEARPFLEAVIAERH